MKLITTIVCLVVLLACGSCKTPCDELKPKVDIAATGIAYALSCKNIEAVKYDVFQYVQKRGWCQDAQNVTGPIAFVVCPFVVNAVVNMALTKTPPYWECSGTVVKTALTTACNALPF